MAYETWWVAYAKEAPHLPICMRKTSRELAEAVGVKHSTVKEVWSRFKAGKLQSSYARFACVFLEKE